MIELLGAVLCLGLVASVAYLVWSVRSGKESR